MRQDLLSAGPRMVATCSSALAATRCGRIVGVDKDSTMGASRLGRSFKRVSSWVTAMLAGIAVPDTLVCLQVGCYHSLRPGSTHPSHGIASSKMPNAA